VHRGGVRVGVSITGAPGQPRVRDARITGTRKERWDQRGGLVMRKGSGIVAVGAALLIAAVGGLIIAWEHRIATRTQVEFAQNGQRVARCSVGDVHCAKVEEVVRSVRPGYMGVMIASWAIVVVGVVLVPIGLIWVRVGSWVARLRRAY
jgi:hypothetical protein